MSKASLNPNHRFFSWKFTWCPSLQVYSHLHWEGLCWSAAGPPITYTVLWTPSLYLNTDSFQLHLFHHIRQHTCPPLNGVVPNWGRASPITEARCCASPRGPSAAAAAGIKAKMVPPKAILCVNRYFVSTVLPFALSRNSLNIMTNLSAKRRYSGHALAHIKIFLQVLLSCLSNVGHSHVKHVLRIHIPSHFS